MNELTKISDVIGKDMFFVHKGTWQNKYEWRIDKVSVRGCRIDEKGKVYVEFGLNCTGYDYPFSYLKSSMKLAKKFAIQQILAEKQKQIEAIEKYIE